MAAAPAGAAAAFGPAVIDQARNSVEGAGRVPAGRRLFRDYLPFTDIDAPECVLGIDEPAVSRRGDAPVITGARKFVAEVRVGGNIGHAYQRLSIKRGARHKQSLRRRLTRGYA